MANQSINTPGKLEGDVVLPYDTVGSIIKAATDTTNDPTNLYTIAKGYARRNPDMINKVQNRHEQVAMFKDTVENGGPQKIRFFGCNYATIKK